MQKQVSWHVRMQKRRPYSPWKVWSKGPFTLKDDQDSPTGSTLSTSITKSSPLPKCWWNKHKFPADDCPDFAGCPGSMDNTGVISYMDPSASALPLMNFLSSEGSSSVSWQRCPFLYVASRTLCAIHALCSINHNQQPPSESCQWHPNAESSGDGWQKDGHLSPGSSAKRRHLQEFY